MWHIKKEQDLQILSTKNQETNQSVHCILCPLQSSGVHTKQTMAQSLPQECQYTSRKQRGQKEIRAQREAQCVRVQKPRDQIEWEELRGTALTAAQFTSGMGTKGRLKLRQKEPEERLCKKRHKEKGNQVRVNAPLGKSKPKKLCKVMII